MTSFSLKGLRLDVLKITRDNIAAWRGVEEMKKVNKGKEIEINREVCRVGFSDDSLQHTESCKSN